METDVRKNPVLLKLDLYCRGMRLDDSVLVEEDGGRKIMRTRAGLGSGLEIIMPGGSWTNVPVTEPFAQESPYTLHKKNGEYIVHLDREPIMKVTLSPRPQWYEAKTSSGKVMTRVASLQGTYLAVYPAKVCEYWTEPVKTN
ncbi:MAG: hypothetical protein MUF51_08665, partial [Vicinamibacteria bacterium]|nr:hypothetical protein [Vicinamibacteria bacterium]